MNQKSEEGQVSQLSRKDFLFKGILTGAAVVGATAILTTCKKEEEQKTDTQGVSCNDTSGLTTAEIEMRENLKYVDHSANPDEICEGCALYVPAEAGASCGTCNLLKGPISPHGYCTSWVKKG